MKKLLIIEELYSDNNGAYNIHWHWDNETKTFSKAKENGYHIEEKLPYVTNEEKLGFAQWWLKNAPVASEDKMVGSSYIVKGSRKVASGTIVEVLNYDRGGYNGTFYNAPSVLVIDAKGIKYNISANCLKTRVQAKLPYFMKDLAQHITMV